MNEKNEKTIHIRYFALLREERGLETETLKTKAETANQLYEELQKRFSFTLPERFLKVAINEAFKPWNTSICENDTIVFIPPVAGG